MKDVKRSFAGGSAARLLLVLCGSIFVSELLVMLLLDTLPPLSRWGEALLDSTLLSIPVFPIIYFFVFRPLRVQLAERQRTEAALRESEHRFRSLFDSSRDAVMTLEPPSWKFTSGNPATVEMFGARDAEHFVTLGPWELSPERQPDGRASAEKAKEMIETALRAGSHIFEWTHQRINGEAFPATVLLSRMEADGKVFLQATVRDITERKRVEAEKAVLLARNQVLVEALAEIRYDWRPKTDEVHWTGDYTRILGYAAEEMGRDTSSWTSRVHPDDLNAVLLEVENAQREARCYDLEYRFRRRDGAYAWMHDRGVLTLDTEGKLERVLGVFRDITERKRAEAALRDSEALYQSLVRHLTQCISRRDREGRFTFVNEHFCRLLGKTPAEILGRTGFEVLPPSSAEQQRRDDLRVVQERLVLEQVEEHSLPDGKKLFVQVVKSPLTNAAGEVVGVQGIFWDVTERKEAEAEREKLIAELKAALANVKSLSGLLPICSGCKKIRDDQNYWHQVETYIGQHTDAQFTHGLCPDCIKKYFPGLNPEDLDIEA